MNVDSILISDYAAVHEGALTVVHTFNLVRATSFPARMPILSLSVIIHAHPDEAETEHELRVVLVNARREVVREVARAPFRLPAHSQAGVPLRHIVVARMLAPAFPEAGPYAFEVLIDGTYHAAAAFAVIEAG